MYLQTLGTSSGVPTITRNVSACAISPEFGRKWFLIDCGEGTQHQILRTRLSLIHLGAIFISHVHGDHCYGLPGLINSMQLNGRTSPLLVCGPDGIQQFVASALKFSDSYIGFEIEFKLVDSNQLVYSDNRVCVNSCELSHRVRSFAYSFREVGQQPVLLQDKLLADHIEQGPVWGKIKKGHDIDLSDGRKIIAKDYLAPPRRSRVIVVAGDNDSPEKLNDFESDIDVLVHEATFTEQVLLKVGEKTMHSSAKRVAEYATKAKIDNLVLTHFSARFSGPDKHSISDLANEAKEYYSGNLFLANDFDRFFLNSDYQLVRSSRVHPET